MQMQYRCPKCERWRPNKSRVFPLEEEIDDTTQEIYCTQCSTPLEVAYVEDSVGKYHCSCLQCGKDISRLNKFCPYCRHRNESFDFGHINLIFCPRCDTQKSISDLQSSIIFDENFCEQCGTELQRADIPKVSCSCGNAMKPWQNFCEQCGAKNAQCKSPEHILKIFELDS